MLENRSRILLSTSFRWNSSALAEGRFHLSMSMFSVFKIASNSNIESTGALTSPWNLKSSSSSLSETLVVRFALSASISFSSVVMKLAELFASPKYSFEILMGVVSRFLTGLVGVVRLTLLLSLVLNYSSETVR